MKMRRRALAVFATLALAALGIPAPAAAAPVPPDTASSTISAPLDLINCTGMSGDIVFSPAITTIPGIISLDGQAESSDCTGSADVTGFTLDFDATLIAGTCVPGTGIVLGTLNAGTMTLHWEGGSGAPSTTFGGAVPAAVQIGPDASVIVYAGVSQAGRFHSALLPSVAEFTITLTNPTPTCGLTDGPQHADLENGSLLIADVL